MSRQRLTWTTQAEQGKTASPPPQIPAVDRTEGPDHPAYLPDPPADKYQTGDTSTWAEDPHPPPYNQSPPPAMPGVGTTEEATHPAHVPQSEVPATGPTTAEEADARAPKQASDIRVAAERHAAVCVRIAQATLKDATVADIERRAMTLMDLPRAQIEATAATLNINAADDDEDQDEASDDDDDAKMGGKKAAMEFQALNKKVDRLVKAFSDFFGMDDMDDMDDGFMDDGEAELDMMMDDDMSDDDLMSTLMGMDGDGDGIDQNADDYAYTAQSEFDEGEESEGTTESDEGKMLAALMAELGEGHMANDAELSVEPLATGPTIQSGEGGNVNPEPAPVTPEVEQMDGSEKTAMPAIEDIQLVATDPSENDTDMTAGVDPMGLMDDSTVASSPNDELLALYADLNLPRTAKKGGEEEDDDEDDDDGEEEVEVEEEVEEKEAGKKKAAQRPQARTASRGPKTLGTVAMSKKAADEIAELSQIWDQAPDVREFFGIPK